MTRECTCVGECRGAAGLAPGWVCALEAKPAPVVDLAAVRARREDEAWRASERRSRELAERMIASLPLGHTWPERFTALMISILGLADTLKIDRATVVGVFSMLAGNVPQLEVEGLEAIDG